MSENNIWKTKLFYITKTLAYICLVHLKNLCMHLADAFIQSDLQSIQAMHFLKLDKLGGVHIPKGWNPLC